MIQLTNTCYKADENKVFVNTETGVKYGTIIDLGDADEISNFSEELITTPVLGSAKPKKRGRKKKSEQIDLNTK